MNLEWKRLRTLSVWPASAPVSAERVARAGFFRPSDADPDSFLVQCYACGCRISDWRYGDSVMARHRELQPNCSFVVDPPVSDNVPIREHHFHGGVRWSLENDDGAASEEFRGMEARMKSFRSWPASGLAPNGATISIRGLAAAGFYYLQREDRVRCAYCGIEACNWAEDFDADEPALEHRRRSPSCPFAAALQPSAATSSQSLTTHPVQSRSINPDNDLDTFEAKSYGILSHRKPINMAYVTEDSRFHSYANWPKKDMKRPEVLAEAGFYYTGHGDQVRCYHCNGGLQKWNISDDPWIEHAKWFPHCDFVYLVKGEEFIKLNSKNNEHISDNATSTPPSMDQILQSYMNKPPATEALKLGLDASRIKQVIKDKYSRGILSFRLDELVQAVVERQFDDEFSLYDLTEQIWVQHADRSLSSAAALAIARTAVASAAAATEADGILREPRITIPRIPPRGSYLNDPADLMPAPDIWDGRISTPMVVEDDEDDDEEDDDEDEDSSTTEEDNAATTQGTNFVVNDMEQLQSYEFSITRHLNNSSYAEADDEHEMDTANRSEECPPSEEHRIHVNNEESLEAGSSQSIVVAPIDSTPTVEMKSQTVHSGHQSIAQPAETNDGNSLEEENRRLKEERTCKVCMDRDSNIVFLPCGHLVTCAICAAIVLDCPICRMTIKYTVKAFLA